MKTKLTKEQILEYFRNSECSSCEFKEECDCNQYDSFTLCKLFGVSY